MLRKMTTTIVNVSGWLAGVSTILILVLVCTEVVVRQFGTSLQIADEFSGYLNAAIIFLGLGYALREGAFIRVEIVYEKLKGPMLTLVRAFIVLTSLGFTVVLTYFLFSHTVYLFEQDTRAVSILHTPEWIPMTAVVVGMMVLLIQLLVYLFTKFKNLP